MASGAKDASQNNTNVLYQPLLNCRPSTSQDREAISPNNITVSKYVAKRTKNKRSGKRKSKRSDKKNSHSKARQKKSRYSSISTRSCSTGEDNGSRRSGKRRYRDGERVWDGNSSQSDISDEESERSNSDSIFTADNLSKSSVHSKKTQSKNKTHDEISSNPVSESAVPSSDAQLLLIDENLQESSRSIEQSPLLISKNETQYKGGFGEITLDMIIKAMRSLTKVHSRVPTVAISAYIQREYEINAEGEEFDAELQEKLELAAEVGEIVRHHDAELQADLWTTAEERLGLAESQNILNRIDSRRYLIPKPRRGLRPSPLKQLLKPNSNQEEEEDYV